MQTYIFLAILSALSFVASQEEEPVYQVNATGEYQFPAPEYASRNNPEFWTAKVAVTNASLPDYFYRTTSWLETPYDAPVNGSTITRDICLFMQLPVIQLAGPIDYGAGGNGCFDVLGEECTRALTTYLAQQYQERTSANGTMDCLSTTNTSDWRPAIYERCPKIAEAGGSGYSFRQLIPSNHETGSALHGNYTGYWTAMQQEKNDDSPEEEYDFISQYVFTYFIISGPTYDNPSGSPTVNTVCVKPEDVTEGSRELPSSASASRANRAMLSITLFLMLITGWLL